MVKDSDALATASASLKENGDDVTQDGDFFIAARPHPEELRARENYNSNNQIMTRISGE